jgi:hypothetical protein
MLITQDGAQLLAQFAGQPRGQLFPESETVFFPKGANIEIEFSATSPGRKADHLFLHQGGPDIVGTRVSEAEAKSLMDAAEGKK